MSPENKEFDEMRRRLNDAVEDPSVRSWELMADASSAFDALRAENERLRVALEWKPIGTVPQGEYVITTNGQFRRFEKFPRDAEHEKMDEWIGEQWKATHWFQTPPAKAALERKPE